MTIALHRQAVIFVILVGSEIGGAKADSCRYSQPYPGFGLHDSLHNFVHQSPLCIKS